MEIMADILLYEECLYFVNKTKSCRNFESVNGDILYFVSGKFRAYIYQQEKIEN